MKPEHWFMYPIDQPLPDKVTVYSGTVMKRKKEGTLNRYQAMAYIRWRGHEGMYYCYRNGNGKYIDVRVVGAIENWFDDIPFP